MSGPLLPVAAEELIPHRRPMRLVDQLLEVTGKNASVVALVRHDSPLVDASGQLEMVAFAELIAQSYAALKGYLDRMEDKPPRRGFLVGIKNLVCRKTVRVGDSLRIEIRTLAELGDFAVAEGEVWAEEEQVACGEIKIWIH